MKYPITPSYLANAPNKLVKIYQDLEEEIMDAICEQLNTGEANETALERIRLLQRRGYPLKEIEKAIKKATGISNKELSKIYGGAIERNKAYFNGVLDKLKLIFSKTRREALEAEVDAITRQTNGTFDNITQSLGFVYHDSSGKLVASPIKDAYEKVLNDAVMQVQSGAFDYNTAIRNAVKRLADSGIQTIDYESGYHCRADVAVRRAVMTGITQISAKYTDALMEEVGTDLLEVTAHPGARDKDGPKGWENHKAWQGKVYSKKRGDIYPCVYDVCGLGDVAGLCGANCRHHYHAFVEGISERAYTDEELANIDKPPFEFEGNKYTAYEATQKQRQLEAALRSIKRRMLDYKAAGLDDYYNAAAIKYRRLTDEYKKFSKAAGLPTQEERAFVPEFTGKDHRDAMKVATNSTAKGGKSSTGNSVNKVASTAQESRSGWPLQIGVPMKGDAIQKRSVYNELQKSNVGRETVDIIEKYGLDVSILYEDVDPTLLGEFFGKHIYIYAKNTKSVLQTVKTIIHEASHAKLEFSGRAPAQRTQWEESYCNIRAERHVKDVLSYDEVCDIIKNTKKAYQEYPWR